MRIFAIGDIHGCAEALETLLQEIPVDWGYDLVVFLGDYIDRGPSSRKVIEIVKGLTKAYPEKVIALSGNHEWMFRRYLQGIEPEVFLFNGGETTLRDYFEKGKLSIPSDDLEFLESLRFYYETAEYIFVHAGLRPGIPLEHQKEEDLVWIRESFYYYSGNFEKIIVFGHTPFPEPLNQTDRIGIDTGCVYGGKLTAVELPARKFYQTSCSRRWG